MCVYVYINFFGIYLHFLRKLFSDIPRDEFPNYVCTRGPIHEIHARGSSLAALVSSGRLSGWGGGPVKREGPWVVGWPPPSPA